MADRSRRVKSAVESLVVHLLPADPQEDEEAAWETKRTFCELVHTILESPDSGSSTDTQHAADLIKRKLIQSNPAQALRFSNLYTRLLALPVLDKKWAILYLLYQLSDSPDPNEPLPVTPSREPVPAQKGRLRPSLADTERLSKISISTTSREQEAFDDAFAPRGLKKLPPEKARSGPNAGVSDEAPNKDKDGRDVALKSMLLASNYVEIDPSEVALLRDLPFTLQGVSSETLPFSKDNSIGLPPTLPIPIVSLLHTLAEPSLLYKGLDSFVKSPARGLLGQSLRAAIGSELRSYLSLVATLEAQIRRALSSLQQSAPRGGIGKAGVTLKRCVVWTREATMGLRLLSVMAEESKDRRGGQLISKIHSFSTSHGDPMVASFAERLLAHVTRPFYDILRRWIYDGELSDPHAEFFVREQRTDDEEKKERKVRGLASVWNSKFEVVQGMAPSIMADDLVQKIFLIGKSLNFTRHSCGDSEWVEAYSKSSSKELRYGDTATLEAWIDEAYKTTMRRLMELMSTKFHLFDHLQALKDFILLGQGDFIALLMESLAANLDRPAGQQYRHTLTAQLEHAIRGSNAQYESPELLKRLDARMLQLTWGDIGWDCFTLEYKVDAPADVVVTDFCNKQYLKVFNFLWHIKRVEFALHSTWRRCMTGARGVLQTSEDKVLCTWKITRGTLAEMIHFIGQLQYYILFEVIESSWAELQKNIRKENCTLDDLIQAHDKFIDNITHKGLLGVKRRQYEDAVKEAKAHGRDTRQVEDRHSYMAQLHELLRNMLAYRDSVDGLYSWAVADFTRRQEVETAGLLSGVAGTSSRPSSSAADFDDAKWAGGRASLTSEFPALQERLQNLGGTYRRGLQALLGDLAYQPDVDLRFLGVAMNFNDVYQPARSRMSKPAGTAATTRAPTTTLAGAASSKA